MDTNGKVLVVDDEPNAVRVLSAILSEEGYHVLESGDVEKAIGIVKTEDVDAIITDLKMPGRDGINFFDYITENHSDIPVIFLTAYGTVESAVHAVTRGAFYYFIKPPDYWKLKSILSRAVEQRCLKRELESLRRRLLNENNHHRIIGKTPEMRRLYETIEAVRDSSSNVLISGETGTGKELFARALHYSSNRKDTPFVAVNCAAIPRELIESELFGYEKGAFTGALSRRIGKFEEAGNGIVFLDEVGELELSLQAKLLRAFQEREVERLGSNRRIKVEFRLICSTNRDLRKEVQNGNFREDLFYRLNVIEIKVPPLRERRDDIPLLVSEFVHEFCIREKKTLTVSGEVMEMFQRHRWPGNIRQLRNVIERAVVLAREKTITAKELPEEFLSCWKQGVAYKSVKTLKDLEIQAVSDALHVCKGNKSKAAKVLGISRKAFYKRLKEIHC
ncbi:MAG: sigma-54 dependent transcriptional regulator [Nitrospirae bacterium]|nr:sigma-54 dependent transcriptional regulator [Nitrospirota bacterium]